MTTSAETASPVLVVPVELPSRPVDLNLIAAWWRHAFDAAHDAIVATTLAPHPLSTREVSARVAEIAEERRDVAELLALDARENHVTLRRRVDAPPATNGDLGLPRAVDACLFDLDGVLAASADLHAAAWAETFDAFLDARLARAGVHFSHFARFSRREDYDAYVHGKPRLDGVRAFLDSRGITLPEGKETDPPGAETVHGLANRKNEVLQRRLREQGVRAYDSAWWYLAAADEASIKCAVISASKNAAAMLQRTGLDDLVDALVDGNVMRTSRLRAMPAPDVVLAACAALGVAPDRTAAFTTTPVRVEAARAAGCALVVAVARTGDRGGLRAAGADVVVDDLGALLGPELKG